MLSHAVASDVQAKGYRVMSESAVPCSSKYLERLAAK